MRAHVGVAQRPRDGDSSGLTGSETMQTAGVHVTCTLIAWVTAQPTRTREPGAVTSADPSKEVRIPRSHGSCLRDPSDLVICRYGDAVGYTRGGVGPH